MSELAKVHEFPGDSVFPEDLIKVAVLGPTSGEPLDGFLAEIAISLWLLRQEPRTLAWSA
jgi:hypothetical protein